MKHGKNRRFQSSRCTRGFSFLGSSGSLLVSKGSDDAQSISAFTVSIRRARQTRQHRVSAVFEAVTDITSEEVCQGEGGFTQTLFAQD